MAIETNSALRERREQLGLTRQQIAAAAGCSLSMVALLESGFTPARSAVRERIEKALGDAEGDGCVAA